MTHTAVLSPITGQFTVWLRDLVVARSTRAVKLVETIDDRTLPPIIYLPIEDLDQTVLTDSEQVTHCPLKGEAHYWNLTLPTNNWKNLVWYYPDPKPEVSGIHGYAAFYPEVINIEYD